MNVLGYVLYPADGFYRLPDLSCIKRVILIQSRRQLIKFFMQYAVIRTGGKQYLVSPGQKLKVEKLEAAQNGAIVFDDVLLVVDGEKAKIGAPQVAGAKVEAKVLTQGRAKKVIVFKYRPKARSRKKKGHRQPYTEVMIEKITR